MSNTDEEKEREARALDALIASAFKEDSCDIDDADIEKFAKAVSDADRAALDAVLGPNFMKSLFSGGQNREKKVRGQLATAMNRSDDDQPPTDKAKEEMERKIKEVEEKRKKEKDQQDGGDDGR